MLQVFVFGLHFWTVTCNTVLSGYKVTESSIDQINTFYVCSTASSCNSVESEELTLNTKYVMVGGHTQKRWYLSNSSTTTSLNNLFGAVELNSKPLQLQTWKRITGLKESHGLEPDMMLHPLNVSCPRDRSTAARSTFETTWLLLAATALTDKTDTSIHSVLSHCASIILQQLKTGPLTYNHVSDIDNTLLRLAYCDYLAYSSSTDGVLECYAKVVDQLTNTTSFLKNTVSASSHLPPPSISVSSASSPLSCERHHSLNMQMYVQCHLLSGRYRMALYALIQLVDPIRVVDIIMTSGGGGQQRIEDFNLKSLLAISKCLLGQQMHCSDLTTRHLRGCSSVLAYAKRYFPSEAVYLMIYKMCSATSNGTPDPLSDGRFLITSLLGVGAVEMAAVHTAHLIESMCASPSAPLEHPSSLTATVRDLVEDCPGLKHFLSSGGVTNTTTLILSDNALNSSNVRAALTLFGVFSRVQLSEESFSLLVRHDELLSLFLNALLQTCSPVILEMSAGVDRVLSSWELEVVILRSVVVVVLDALLIRCSPIESSDSLTPRCALIAPHSSVGGRGLFLLAYQGAALISHIDGRYLSPETTALLSDWTVPSKYRELVTVTNPQINRQYIAHTSESATINAGTEVSSDRKPRVAFLSFFFTRHSVGRLLARIVTQIDANRFDVLVVTKQPSSSAPRDDVSEYLHSVVPADHWLYLPLSINQALDTLRSASIDVLVFGDVFMDSFVAHLTMTRCAPIQVSFWGHPFTSGYLDTMDYFITSLGFEPPLQQGWDSRQDGQFSEQLVRFDSLSFQMFPAEERVSDAEQQQQQQAVNGYALHPVWSELSSERDALCLGESSSFASRRLSYLQWVLSVARNIHNVAVDTRELLRHLVSLGNEDNTTAPHITLCGLLFSVRVYGALQSLFKMHPLFDAALLNILRNDPAALVLLSRNPKQTVWQRRLSERLLALESSSRGGSNASDHSALSRVLFVDQMPHAQYAKLLCGVDVSLDPFPFGGGVTLCDAVSGGCDSPVPFVTSGALQSVHRIGSGLADVFNDPSVARSSKSSTLQGGYANEVIEYSIAAVDLAKASLARKTENAPVSSTAHIQYSVYQDNRAPDEWNHFLTRLTSQL